MPPVKSLKQRLQWLFRLKVKANTNGVALSMTAGPKASSGKVINLMSIDAFQVGELGSCLHDLFPTLPVQLLVAASLLYSVMGWSALISMGLMVLLMPVNLIFATLFTKAYQRVMQNTDARISITNEVLEAIKVIKVRLLTL